MGFGFDCKFAGKSSTSEKKKRLPRSIYKMLAQVCGTKVFKKRKLKGSK